MMLKYSFPEFIVHHSLIPHGKVRSDITSLTGLPTCQLLTTFPFCLLVEKTSKPAETIQTTSFQKEKISQVYSSHLRG